MRLWARDAAIEKKDILKARGYSWSPGEFRRPKCWYRDVSDADRAAELSWLRANVSSGMGVADDGEGPVFGSMLVLG
jgi:DNA polymerase III subunit epsilon